MSMLVVMLALMLALMLMLALILIFILMMSMLVLLLSLVQRFTFDVGVNCGVRFDVLFKDSVLNGVGAFDVNVGVYIVMLLLLGVHIDVFC